MRDVTIAYGMTEPARSASELDRRPIERRVTTIGRVHPHVEVKMVDMQGRIVKRGAPGEFCTRGYSVMSGYWGEAEKTREAQDAAGWMHTGDLATIDAEGYGNIVGRIKDMVIRGGENIYPREVEEFLYKHPGSRTCRCSASPTIASARSLRLGARARRRDAYAPRRCAPSARARSPKTRSRAMSSSSTNSR